MVYARERLYANRRSYIHYVEDLFDLDAELCYTACMNAEIRYTLCGEN